jgi:hypothetical protein
MCFSYADPQYSLRRDWIRSDQQRRFSLVHGLHNIAPQWLLLRRYSRVGLIRLMYRNIVRSIADLHDPRFHYSSAGTPCPAVHSALQWLLGVLLLFTLVHLALGLLATMELEPGLWLLRSKRM